MQWVIQNPQNSFAKEQLLKYLEMQNKKSETIFQNLG